MNVTHTHRSRAHTHDNKHHAIFPLPPLCDTAVCAHLQCLPFRVFRLLTTGVRDGARFMVTNERFGEFVGNTSYKTDSEKYGWSFVFLPMLSMRQQREIQQVGG